jgi:hypothetical protein
MMRPEELEKDSKALQNNPRALKFENIDIRA